MTPYKSKALILVFCVICSVMFCAWNRAIMIHLHHKTVLRPMFFSEYIFIPNCSVDIDGCSLLEEFAHNHLKTWLKGTGSAEIACTSGTQSFFKRFFWFIILVGNSIFINIHSNSGMDFQGGSFPCVFKSDIKIDFIKDWMWFNVGRCHPSSLIYSLIDSHFIKLLVHNICLRFHCTKLVMHCSELAPINYCCDTASSKQTNSNL